MNRRLYLLAIMAGMFLLLVFPVQSGLMAQGGLTLNKIVICTDVVDRTPVGADVEFSEDVGTLICFTAVANSGNPTTVTHIWSYLGEEKARTSMNVGTSPNWRTWSTKKILPEWSGPWTVTVLDAAGAEIGSADFHIGPVEMAPMEAPEPEPVMEEAPPAPEAKPVEEVPPEATVEEAPRAPEAAPAPEVEPEEPPAPMKEVAPPPEPEEEPAPVEEEEAPPDTAAQAEPGRV